MKNKGFLTAKFHCRAPGDHAKAGKSREKQGIDSRHRHAPPARLTRGEPIPWVAGCCPAIAEWLRPLASLGVVAMTVQRDRKTR
jgi:hypothetical protein